MKRKRKLKKIFYIFIPILSFWLLIYSLSQNRTTNFLEIGLKTLTDSFSNLMIGQKEVDVNQSESYTIEKNKNEILQKEIEELKSILEIKNTYTDYEVVNASVLVKNKSYWLNTLSIDKGKNNGITKDMAVITKNGLIGKVEKVYRNSSEVKLLTTRSNYYRTSIFIQTQDSEDAGILSGFNKNYNLLKITEIDKNSKLKKGDKVMTSGLGGVFPKGIYIGEVEKITNDKYNLSKTAYVKTNQDYNNIHYVSILKLKND